MVREKTIERKYWEVKLASLEKNRDRLNVDLQALEFVEEWIQSLTPKDALEKARKEEYLNRVREDIESCLENLDENAQLTKSAQIAYDDL